MLLSPQKYVLVCFVIFTALSISTRQQSRTDCQSSTCGTVRIEQPFATSSDCVHEGKFLLRCDEKEKKLFLNSSNLEVLSISFDDGEVEVLMNVISICNHKEADGGNKDRSIDNAGFVFSNKNQLFLVGCDFYINYYSTSRVDGTTSFTCDTHCDSLPPRDKSCSGYNGCCRTPVFNLQSKITVSRGNYIGWSSSDPCKYVFMVKDGYFNFSASEDLKNLRNITRFPVILDWIVRGTCEETENTNLCGENSKCTTIANLTDCYGYGMSANQMLNLAGRIKPARKLMESSVIVIGCLVFVVGVCCILLKLIFRQVAKLKERRFESNGGVLLAQRLLESPNQCIKIFSEDEIMKATHEASFLGRGGQGVVFRATLPDNVEVAIKRSRNWDPDQAGQFVNEIILLSQISHPNVVRLLGCCLETPSPLLVYEYVPGGTLHDTLFGSSSLAWPDRLRIASEIAETLSYLHFSGPVPIVHRDIKPENILLTETLSVKLCDFGASRQVPNNTGQLTTLVQDAAFKENRLSEVMDQRVVTADNQAVIHQVALLGMSCTKMCGVERPDMRRVAEDLRGLQASRQVVQHEAGPSGTAFEIEEIE
ncbi:unnamed protein product [Eruca vesicaria subsp. sativa]|uniref:Protein kinase domain-containing protein n=1 Tax=Eruca vesicaria subsp. sativa TaxID=29727 RepID=A0ABC8J541_ERUVS|nr:unnamed protein product [Eruca vesicaria subsp. sativa]